jgi:hypothetical protein
MPAPPATYHCIVCAFVQLQVLDQFHWLMAWNAAMPPQHINTMLESFFFPKLQQVLYQWLVSNPNYEEVTQWYLGWKVSALVYWTPTLPKALCTRQRVCVPWFVFRG